MKYTSSYFKKRELEAERGLKFIKIMFYIGLLTTIYLLYLIGGLAVKVIRLIAEIL